MLQTLMSVKFLLLLLLILLLLSLLLSLFGSLLTDISWEDGAVKIVTFLPSSLLPFESKRYVLRSLEN